MNALHRRIASSVACIAVPLLITAPPVAAKPTVCEIVARPSLDARLTAKADQGTASLRRYVTLTRTIYALDMPTAMAKVDRFRQRRADCAATSAP